MRFAPKDYQTESLNIVQEYAQGVRERIIAGADRPERAAFEHTTGGRSYFSTPGFENVPYVCIRIPTGGGKTLFAAEAIGKISRSLLETDHPACLWITPGSTIRDQTLRALRTPHHPYRLALEDSLGPDVEVATLEEVLLSSQKVRATTALVIVTNIQSYRITNEQGQEIADTRRIYRDNGYMTEAFARVPAWMHAELSKDDNGNVELSLANALRLRRPIVIMDEAHNARTPVSFESLARFGPSFVLELTATPEQKHQPQHPTDPKFASNVLHAVSALELKKQGMIKLPVDLESRGDWLEVLAATKKRRDDLELIIDRAYEDVGIPRYRPIALIQAQKEFRNRETQTVHVVRQALIDRFDVPEEEIVIHTGAIKGLDSIADITAADCQVRYVITVDALREGWDCPIAWVLGSIGNTATPTAVEQLIGRILRMPNATPTRIPALDRCYAFVLSDNIAQTALQLRDQMVRNCGFDERSADDALRVVSEMSQPRLGFGAIRVTEPPKATEIPPTLAAKLEFNKTSGELILSDELSAGELRILRDALPNEEDKTAVDNYWESERPVGVTPKLLTEFARPLRVPRLTVLHGKERSLFEPAELEEFRWDLDSCNPTISEQEFSSDVSVGTAALINIESDDPKKAALTVRQVGEVRLRQLELIAEGEDWSEGELVRWLDSELHRGDSLAGLPLSESQPWLRRMVVRLIEERGIDRAMLVRRRHKLAQVLRTIVLDHGRKQTRKAADELFQKNPEAVATSQEHAKLVEEQDYQPVSLFDRGQIFFKHAFDFVADMNGEELECAQRIDAHANVARWIRNTESVHHGGFSLPKSPGRFYPDFIVELKDDRTALVEYKMLKISKDDEELHKKAVGEMWADRSGGQCVFGWVVDKDWTALERALSTG